MELFFLESSVSWVKGILPGMSQTAMVIYPRGTNALCKKVLENICIKVTFQEIILKDLCILLCQTNIHRLDTSQSNEGNCLHALGIALVPPGKMSQFQFTFPSLERCSAIYNIKVSRLFSIYISNMDLA